MPQLSDTMDEGTILTWHKQVGERVERGDALAEVATDKADLEIESFHEGVLLKIHSPEGTTVKVGSIIAHVGEEGEAVESAAAPASPKAEQSPAPAAETAPATPPSPPASPPASQPASQPAPQAAAPQAAPQAAPPSSLNGDERVKISPLARNLAQTHGVDYGSIRGTGEGGRIVKRDIESALGRSLGAEEQAPQPASAPAPKATQPAPAPAAAKPAAPAPSSVQAGTQPLSKMRTTIASRMVQSMTEIPHFYVSTKLELDALVKMRASLKQHPQYEGITYNHLMIKAVALALKAHPRINARFQDNSLVQPAEVNIGIITALPDGLLIPVVKQADSLPLADVISEANALVQRARSGRPKPDDLVGGTFSISNIGRSKVEDFTAIINPGQGAILAVAGMQDEPVVRDGEIVVGKTMRVTLSVDHRIIDGLVAGEFVTELKRLIEDPVLLLA